MSGVWVIQVILHLRPPTLYFVSSHASMGHCPQNEHRGLQHALQLSFQICRPTDAMHPHLALGTWHVLQVQHNCSACARKNKKSPCLMASNTLPNMLCSIGGGEPLDPEPWSFGWRAAPGLSFVCPAPQFGWAPVGCCHGLLKQMEWKRR